MVATFEKISSEIFNSYTHTLSEKDRVNDVLDHILDKKQQFNNLSSEINALTNLVSNLTWINNLTESDEVIIQGLIDIGKKVDLQLRKFYSAEIIKYSNKDWFNVEFNDFQSAIDLHQETLIDVEHIIFQLRKDNEFTELTEFLDEL